MSPRAATVAASAAASGFGWQGAGGCSARAIVAAAISGRSSAVRKVNEFLRLDLIICFSLGRGPLRAGREETSAPQRGDFLGAMGRRARARRPADPGGLYPSPAFGVAAKTLLRRA